MNTAYNYKNGKDNINSYNVNSKKGTASRVEYTEPTCPDFAEKCLTLIDAFLELFSSARLFVAAKAFFGFIILLGFIGVIGGIELGKFSLLAGVVCLALLIGAEFVVLKD